MSISIFTKIVNSLKRTPPLFGALSLIVGVSLSVVNIYVAIDSARQREIDREAGRPRFLANYFTVTGMNDGRGIDVDNLLGVLMAWDIEERKDFFRNNVALSSPVLRNEIIDYSDIREGMRHPVVKGFVEKEGFCDNGECELLSCNTTFLFIQNIGQRHAHDVVVEFAAERFTPDNYTISPAPIEAIDPTKNLQRELVRIGEIAPMSGVLIPIYCQMYLYESWPPQLVTVGLALKPMTISAHDPILDKSFVESIREPLETAVEIYYGVQIRG